MASRASFQEDAVASGDGSTIGYRTAGAGPGAIVIHGGGSTSAFFLDLAAALADDFTVYAPDRRGRGLSLDVTDARGLDKEVEDIAALAEQTGATRIVGISAGAIVALHAAIAIPAVTHLALFEPPLQIPGVSELPWVPRYEREVAEGRFGAALATIVKGTEGVRKPHFVLTLVLNAVLRRADAKMRAAGAQPMSELVRAMRDDIRIVQASAGALDRVGGLACAVLLMGGDQSPAFYAAVLDRLSAALPQARRVTLAGVGHRAGNDGGRPELVAGHVRAFFQERPTETHQARREELTQ